MIARPASRDPAAKNKLSALIKRVQRGDSILITDRGVPVAQLVPVRIIALGRLERERRLTDDDRLARAARREGFEVLGA